MRIGVLTSLYPSPEAPFEGIFAARKWEGLLARGHDVRVVTPVPYAPKFLAPLFNEAQARLGRVPVNETRSGIEIHRPRYLHLPRAAVRNAVRFADAGRKVMPDDIDVCVFDYAWPAAAGVTAFGPAPVVINGRGSDVLQVAKIPALRRRLADALRSADALTAVSQDLLDTMVELCNEGGWEASADEIVAVLTPNGVDEAHFCPGVRREALGRLGQPAGAGPLVICVGHLIPRKDPLLALRTFQQANVDGARMVFVGRGELEGQLRAEIDALGAEGRVELVGERPPEELVDWYRAANVLLLTSSREGRPNVVLEALSTGCPVLATNAGGTAEIVPDHERMLATTWTPEAMGAQLRALLLAPPDSATLRAAVSELSWKASLDTLESLLESLVNVSAR